MFLRIEAMFWVLNFDLSDALTLRGGKFWLSNAQPGVQFLMNDAIRKDLKYSTYSAMYKHR